MNQSERLTTLCVRSAWIVALALTVQAVRALEPEDGTVAESVSAASSLSEAFRHASDRAAPGLVAVYTLRGPRMTDAWRRRQQPISRRHPMNDHIRFSAASRNTTGDEQGSGIIIDRQGLILTCNHIVESADAIFVVLPDGRRFEPVEVRGDPTTDLAVIRIEAAVDITDVTLGNSDELQVGDWVVSLANPYNLKESVSAGVVSATERWIPGTPHALIQNDAATNPGSSGGALLNLQGEVVGIVAGGFSSRREFQGIGLAIPVNTAKRVVEELASNPEVQRPYLGCHTQKLTPELARQLELPVAGGLYVKDVAQDSPAETAGIVQGDILTHFAGRPIDDTFRPEQLYNEPIPGEKYVFTLFRAGDSISVEVEMGQSPAQDAMQYTHPKIQSTHSSEHYDKSLGLGIDNLTADLAQQLEFPQETRGVLVTDVLIGGAAYREGVAAGMVVLRFNSHAILNLDDYRQATRKYPLNKPVLMLIQSNKGEHLIIFRRHNPSTIPSSRAEED